MKTRTALSILFIGLAVLALGGMFKMLHWPSANIQLLLGTLAQVTALVALALNVSRRKNVKELLER